MATRRKGKKARVTIGRVDDVWKRSPDIIRRFIEQRANYEQLCIEIAYILSKRFKDREIEISAVTWRAKTLKSFLEKIERKKYDDPFKAITDFAGVRVVCLYLTDIKKIEEIVGQEFEVVEKVDKLTEKGADKFGYGAVHFIAKIGRGSSGARYDDLKDLVCEIQVRTVLQDAWAIIDHHLVYKNESDVPTPLQRKLNSLAGLFETADDQFEHIRLERSSYLEVVRDSQVDPHMFLSNELNKDSLSEYLEWKFPTLPRERHVNQIDDILGGIDRNSYRKLSDIDAAVELAKGRLKKVSTEIQLGISLKYAASQVALALALTDKQYRNSIIKLYPPEISETLQKHAIK